MAVQQKTQPPRRRSAARRRRRRRQRICRGLFLASFLIVAASVLVVLPKIGVLPAGAEAPASQDAPAIPAASNLPIIAIDPGHGGVDPGSEGSGVWEYQMTWQTANDLADLLTQDGRFAPILTLSESESQDSSVPRVEPAERAARANDAGAVLLFSIHGNADASSSTDGFECYPVTPGHSNHEDSLQLAQLVAAEMQNAGASLRGENGVRYIYFGSGDDRLVFESSDESTHSDPSFGILEAADCPAILVEQCFLTSPSDAASFASQEGCQRAAQAYYNAICAWWESTMAGE